MDPETRIFQAAKGKNLVILACTVFDWSNRVVAVAAFARKNGIKVVP